MTLKSNVALLVALLLAGCTSATPIGRSGRDGGNARRRRALEPGHRRPPGARLRYGGLRQELRAGRRARDHSHSAAGEGRRLVHSGPGDDDPVFRARAPASARRPRAPAFITPRAPAPPARTNLRSPPSSPRARSRRAPSRSASPSSHHLTPLGTGTRHTAMPYSALRWCPPRMSDAHVQGRCPSFRPTSARPPTCSTWRA